MKIEHIDYLTKEKVQFKLEDTGQAKIPFIEARVMVIAKGKPPVYVVLYYSYLIDRFTVGYVKRIVPSTQPLPFTAVEVWEMEQQIDVLFLDQLKKDGKDAIERLTAYYKKAN